MPSPGQEVQSKRLLNLTLACPECGTIMRATGKMQYSPVIQDWLIEYWCPVDQEFFQIYTPESSQLAKEIVGDLP
jgi:hypothetical protein